MKFLIFIKRLYQYITTNWNDTSSLCVLANRYYTIWNQTVFPKANQHSKSKAQAQFYKHNEMAQETCVPYRFSNLYVYTS